MLVGELLVWNEQKEKIMLFYKIPRYVLRAGRQLGYAENSPPSEDEALDDCFCPGHFVSVRAVFIS